MPVKMGQKLSGGMKTLLRDSSAHSPGAPYQRRLTNGRHAAYDSDLDKTARLDSLLSRPPADKEEQLKHSWNPDDRSLNIFLKDDDDGLTLHRHPVAQSTDGVRGRVGHTRGLHVWELRWERRYRGTHAVVGVATTGAPLHCTGYRSLIGSTEDSWGWDLCRNRLCHSGSIKHDTVYPTPAALSRLNDSGDYQAPETIFVVLDMDEGTLGFVAEGRYLGTAFRGLKGRQLYPVVSAVWGHCEITMKYIGGLDREFFILLLRIITIIISVISAEVNKLCARPPQYAPAPASGPLTC